jgi:alcohol dehydrogenase class IV
MKRRKAHPLAPIYRIYQLVIRLAMYCVKWRHPEVLSGNNCVAKLPEAIERLEVTNVLIVTDKAVKSLGLLDILLERLKTKNITFVLYDGTVSNPTIPCITEAFEMYGNSGCGGVIAVGGGSVIDCAKAVCIRVARPNKPIIKMRGLLKVRGKLPPLFAVPTTSGTGSEATLAAVVVDPNTHEKFAINDPCLFPAVAVLDPMMTASLPPHLTATTGMDALTHAVEAYIGNCNTTKTRAYARNAVKLIFDNLPAAYQNGQDMAARQNMQQAAFEAGVAFTRAYVGNVHAVAHTLGGFYNVPHGLANAVILPYVLDAYGSRVYRRLAELADLVGIAGDTPEGKSEAFIKAIRELNERLGIPDRLDCIKQADIWAMCKNALAEANPVYPVPIIFTKRDFAQIYEAVHTGGKCNDYSIYGCETAARLFSFGRNERSILSADTASYVKASCFEPRRSNRRRPQSRSE